MILCTDHSRVHDSRADLSLQYSRMLNASMRMEQWGWSKNKCATSSTWGPCSILLGVYVFGWVCVAAPPNAPRTPHMGRGRLKWKVLLTYPWPSPPPGRSTGKSLQVVFKKTSQVVFNFRTSPQTWTFDAPPNQN